ncbi:MAG: Fic family protein [Oscillospiraceae bacterium]
MQIKELIAKIERFHAAIQSYRPLSSEEVRELDNYFRIGSTYSSNALEGNSLSLNETKILIEDGITVGGKPIRDCYEATGHAKAYDFMLTAARRDESMNVTEELIKRLHYLFYCGINEEAAGQYREHQVFITGTSYLPPAPEDVQPLMSDFVDELSQRSALHPIEIAAFAHRRLVDIHPFSDGNGRTARLLMNLILVNKGYCIISIPPVLRHEYISALQLAQREKKPRDTEFISLIAECEIEAQKDYCRLFRIALPKEDA